MSEIKSLELRKTIFGKHVSLTINADKSIVDILKKELELYDSYNNNENHDLLIKVSYLMSPTDFPKLLLQNPNTHYEYAEGFGINYGSYMILWFFQPKLKISLFFRKRRILRKLMEKFLLSYQFSTPEESIGQILHENILVPLTFFLKNIAPIHGSSVLIDGKYFLIFGGTGGSGKSSILLALKNTCFISDDMLIVDENGKIYPNYSFPKIYAYNTIGNKKLERILMKNSTLLECINWTVRKKINPSKVRKRINPNLLWKICKINDIKGGIYYVLNKGYYEKIHLEEISMKKAIDLTLKIMQTEYSIFFNHIIWHEYNRNLINLSPLLETEVILKRWGNIYKNFFQKNNCKFYKVNIPITIHHNEFINNFLEIIEKNKGGLS